MSKCLRDVVAAAESIFARTRIYVNSRRSCVCVYECARVSGGAVYPASKRERESTGRCPLYIQCIPVAPFLLLAAATAASWRINGRARRFPTVYSSE